ncbi:MAG TPA: C4-dicarboxylic acid transporter DauA [Pseudomonadales bacterium]|nr:C4-dicarboxylic acid transporter DauA [Pseudomonadales bacterium]
MSEQSDAKIPFATAIREVLANGYNRQKLIADLLAGVTLGVIAIPLAMALAIAVGVPPQHGLYTSIVAGVIIAISGGSRFNISGPTAAFVVILLPITSKFGLGGLLLATCMAGLILVLMGLTRMGRLIEYIPYPVTTGFTTGIAVVIATLQIKDFFGLHITQTSEHFTERVLFIVSALPTLRWEDTVVAVTTFFTLLMWPKINRKIPGHLMALLAGTLMAILLEKLIPSFSLETLGSRFHFSYHGVEGNGIPPFAPEFLLPWQLPDAEGKPLGFSLNLIRELMGPALAIALLGAIESLLCAVVADGIAGTKHDPNAELIGQGLGNIIVPFFGGIPATAAIARTAANVRAGAVSPLAAATHGVVVLLAVVVLARYMSVIPMASLAALLVMVAWNMSDAKHFLHVTRSAPRSDVAVLLVCFFLTVIFDMVLAVGVGMALAATLFIRRMTELTGVTLLSNQEHEQLRDLPSDVAVYDVNGPLFFAAAEQAMNVITRYNRNIRFIVLDMSDVPLLDITAIVLLESALKKMMAQNVTVIVCGLNKRLIQKLHRAGIEETRLLRFAPDFASARAAFKE